MEATSLLNLILLSSVGARNIPAVMNAPTREFQQIIEDNFFTYRETFSESEPFSKDPVEEAVSTGALEPTSDKDVNNGEKSKEQNVEVPDVYIVEDKSVSIKTKVYEYQPSDKTTGALTPAGIVNEDEEKTNESFEDRSSFDGNNCPDGGKRGPDFICHKIVNFSTTTKSSIKAAG